MGTLKTLLKAPFRDTLQFEEYSEFDDTFEDTFEDTLLIWACSEFGDTFEDTFEDTFGDTLQFGVYSEFDDTFEDTFEDTFGTLCSLKGIQSLMTPLMTLLMVSHCC